MRYRSPILLACSVLFYSLAGDSECIIRHVWGYLCMHYLVLMCLFRSLWCVFMYDSIISFKSSTEYLVVLW